MQDLSWKNNWKVDYLYFKKLQQQLHFLFQMFIKSEKQSHSDVTFVIRWCGSYPYMMPISPFDKGSKNNISALWPFLELLAVPH